MATLRILTELIHSDPDAVRACKVWLKREHAATIKRVNYNAYVTVYSVEGRDIPEGEKEIGLVLEELVPNVFIIGLD